MKPDSFFQKPIADAVKSPPRLRAGKGLMIHAPNSRSFVRVEAFDTGSYALEYWGARRYGS